MSIASEITRLQNIKSNIRTALGNKGIDASTHNYANFADDIGDIQTGEQLNSLDSVAFGNDPVVDEYGKTASDYYEDIADAINLVNSRSNGVSLETLNIAFNGTVNAPSGKAYNQVHVTVPMAEDKDINFYDLDGNRLFSYTREEFAELTVLPVAPNRPDLFLNFTQWNWTKSEIDAQPGYVEVGALYDLTDCDCALIVEPTIAIQLNATLRFYCGSGNTVQLDWGDGSMAETYTQSGSNQTVVTHIWPELYRRYRIRLTRLSGTNRIQPGGNANAQIMYSQGNTDTVGQSAAREIYIGSICKTGTTLLGASLLDRCIYCTSAEKQTSQIYFRGPFFILSRNSNYAKAAVYAFENLYLLCSAGNSFLPFSDASGFRHARNQKITIPQGTTQIGAQCFSGCKNIDKLQIPSSITNIAGAGISNAGLYCAGALRELWFFGTTPPVLAASTSINLYAYTTIFVPFSSIAAYLTGTNYPSPATQPYIGFATYASGAALPSTDTTNAYSITWYASKADAAAGTNPITIGNGKQIYCTAEEITT